MMALEEIIHMNKLAEQRELEAKVEMKKMCLKCRGGIKQKKLNV